MWDQFNNKDIYQVSSGIDVSLEELLNLRKQIIFKKINKKDCSRELFTGESMSKIRGRGIEFDSTREYHPGDDIRRMAWRVTARSLKSHIKIYHEEKECPVWLVVDLSPSLYFGTRCMFKSVRSIKQAALLGWLHLQTRNRVGAVIATTHKTDVYKPQVREREFLQILKKLTECSRIYPAFTESNCLQNALLNLQQQARAGNTIFILSDFFNFNSDNQKLILHFAQHSQVILIFIYDPFEALPPPANRYLLTDGQQQVFFNMDVRQTREQYKQQFQHKLDTLKHFAHKHRIIFQILSTNGD